MQGQRKAALEPGVGEGKAGRREQQLYDLPVIEARLVQFVQARAYFGGDAFEVQDVDLGEGWGLRATVDGEAIRWLFWVQRTLEFSRWLDGVMLARRR